MAALYKEGYGGGGDKLLLLLALIPSLTTRSTMGASWTKLKPSVKNSRGIGNSASFGRDSINFLAHGVVSDIVVGNL